MPRECAVTPLLRCSPSPFDEAPLSRWTENKRQIKGIRAVKSASTVKNVAFVGDYLPRKCGIATFTSDLLEALAARQHPPCRCFAVAVNDVDRCYRYPDAVRFEIEEQDLRSYQRAADFLNSSRAGVVSVQHEFGIFGGPAGSHLLALLSDLKIPAVTTLHTVLREPNADQRHVTLELIAQSSRLVVMTERGKTILQEVYHAPPSRIDVIPHGIPDVPFAAPDLYKGQFGVAGKKVLLTFGLLSPNKGIEHVLNALPNIVAEFPDLVYIVLGATHPHELRTRGEAYRHSLEAIVKKNRLEKNVIFHDRFVELKELTEFIGAADLYVTPYLDEAQSTSGTLAYAFGAGKAVISTPYWHASELLRDQRGVLVPFADPSAIAREASGLLRDERRRNAMSDRAYKLGREMVWSNTAKLYMRSFELARRQAAAQPRKAVAVAEFGSRLHAAPELNLDHLYQMTDSTGILQHATFEAPNLAEGYCTDDNARALILAVLLAQTEVAPVRVRALASTYAAFLHGALDPKTKRFRNFLSIDGHWLDEQGSEDSHGRAIWALGTAVGRSPQSNSQALAEKLFVEALPAVMDFTSPRAWAFSLIGIHEYLSHANGDREAKKVREELTRRLMSIFDQVAQPGWPWFEDGLTYDNAKLAHALIVSGYDTRQEKVYERGIEALRWLIGVQTTPHGHHQPIGNNGFYKRNGSRAQFDQQPIEAQTTVSACLAAYSATSDPWWYEQAQSAFDWFLGGNDLGLQLYCPRTGGCRDGLEADRGNENQGAESMLAFLLSLTEMQLMNDTAAGVQRRSLAASQ